MSGAATSEPIAAERRDVVALARELARRELAPQALALDERRPSAFEAAWKRIAASGYDRALLATDDGGAGLDAGSIRATQSAMRDAGITAEDQIQLAAGLRGGARGR